MLKYQVICSHYNSNLTIMKKDKQNKTSKSKDSQESASRPKSPRPRKEKASTVQPLPKLSAKSNQQQTNTGINPQPHLNPQRQVDNGDKKTLDQSFVIALQKCVKEKILPNTVQGLMKELQRRNIWTKDIRQEGIARLIKISHEVIDFQLDRLEVFNKERIFGDKNVKEYGRFMQKKKEQNGELLNGIIKDAVEIGVMVRNHKIKTEVLTKAQEKIKKRRVKVRPQKRIEALENELNKLTFFLEKNQHRCDIISERLSAQIKEAQMYQK